MNYRSVYITEDEDLGTAGTDRNELFIEDPISRLHFIANISTPVGVATPVAHPVSTIKKIELLDGSDVLMSLTGTEAMAAGFYDRRELPLSYYAEGDTLQSYFDLTVDFGRFLWDQDLAFKPTAFKNPVLNVEYDKTKMDAGATAMTYCIVADIFDEKAISPQGFLLRKAVESWTPTDSAHKYITMPDDYVIRKMFLRGFSTDKKVRDGITNVKLSENQDKKIPLDMDTREYNKIIGNIYPKVREQFKFNVTANTNTTFFPAPSYEKIVYMQSEVQALHQMNLEACQELVIQNGENGIVTGEVQGLLPFMTYCFDFGMQDVIEDWYDVRTLGSLKLDVTAGTVGTSPENTLFLEQLRPY
jgi:hypothetical protein